MDISQLPGMSSIKVKTKRMKEKDKKLGVLNMPEATEVDVEKRLELIRRRKRAPIIYHKITANRTYSTINVQIRVCEGFYFRTNFHILLDV